MHNRGVLSSSRLGFYSLEPAHSSYQMMFEVVGGIVIARQDMEGVAVDLHVTAEREVLGVEEFAVVVDILVLSALEEGPRDEAGVLYCGLVDGKRVAA